MEKTKEKANPTWNGYGIASLVLGIFSVLTCALPIFGIASGIVGIVCYSKQKKYYPNGIATAGLITSIVGISLSVLYAILWASLIAIISSVYAYA